MLHDITVVVHQEYYCNASWKQKKKPHFWEILVILRKAIIIIIEIVHGVHI